MSLNRLENRSRGLSKKQVAFLASEGMTQKQIASRLGYSQSTVSLLLHEATNPKNDESQILDPRPRFLASDDERIQVQNSLSIGELNDTLEKYAEVKKLSMIPKIYLGITAKEKNWDLNTRAWGQALAPSLEKLLRPTRSVCVSWGRQLRGLIDGISTLQVEPRKKNQTQVFACWPPRLSVRPESEDTIYKDHIALESNALAFDLGVGLNGTEPSPENALHYLPGMDFIPFTKYPFRLQTNQTVKQIQEEIRKEEEFLKEIKTALFQIDAYKTIFGTPEERTKECLLRNVDAAILPAGPAGGGRSFTMGENYGGIPEEWFKEKTIGDIGGVLIHVKEHKDMTPKEKLQYQRVRMHWMGMWEEDIKHIAKNGSVGTIVGAVDGDRVMAVHYGIKKQLIRHLFCDHSLATALTTRLKEELTQ